MLRKINSLNLNGSRWLLSSTAKRHKMKGGKETWLYDDKNKYVWGTEVRLDCQIVFSEVAHILAHVYSFIPSKVKSIHNRLTFLCDKALHGHQLRPVAHFCTISLPRSQISHTSGGFPVQASQSGLLVQVISSVVSLRKTEAEILMLISNNSSWFCHRAATSHHNSLQIRKMPPVIKFSSPNTSNMYM